MGYDFSASRNSPEYNGRTHSFAVRANPRSDKEDTIHETPYYMKMEIRLR